MPSSVLFPEPVLPNTNAWPTSESCRLTRNGVAPAVAAHKSGGLPGGKSDEGFVASPGHTLVTGSRSATFRVLIERAPQIRVAVAWERTQICLERVDALDAPGVAGVMQCFQDFGGRRVGPNGIGIHHNDDLVEEAEADRAGRISATASPAS